MNAIAGLEAGQAVEQRAELALVLDRFHARVFLCDELELLFGVVRHMIFGRIFRPVRGEVPVEALQPTVHFLRTYADRGPIGAKRVRRCLGSGT